MKRSHRFLLTAAGVSIAFAVPGLSAAKKVTIDFATWGEPPYIEDVIRPMVKRFEAKYPNIKVDLQASPWVGWHDKLLTATAAGLAPDVMAFSRNYAARLVSARVLRPLEPIAKSDRGFSFAEYLPSTLAFAKYQGRTYGLPWAFTPDVLYYNRGLFRNAGLEEPYQAFKAGRWSWSDFLDAAKTLTNKSQKQYASQHLIVYPEGLFQWIVSNGGNMMNPLTGKPTATDPLTIEAIQFIVDLKRKHDVVGGDFFAGKMAMTFGWMGYFTESNFRSKLDLDVGFWPNGKGGSHTEVGGVGYGIASSSKHLGEAWLLLKFLTSEEVERRNLASAIPPTRKALLGDYIALKGEPSHKDVYEFYAVAAGMPKPLPTNTTMFEALVNEELAKAYDGKVSVTQACTTLQGRLVAVLKK